MEKEDGESILELRTDEGQDRRCRAQPEVRERDFIDEHMGTIGMTVRSRMSE